MSGGGEAVEGGGARWGGGGGPGLKSRLEPNSDYGDPDDQQDRPLSLCPIN